MSPTSAGHTVDVDGPVPEAEPAARGANRYEVVRELARGGLGRVLIGHDRVLGRPVAIKELLRPSPSNRVRFAREVQVTARLEHPSIVPVHDAGAWDDGEPFYTMKLVSGVTLADAIAARPTLVERLSLLDAVIDVCHAMAYAHDKRVIHRDLKPQNVLVGAFGENVVLDWGIAKDLAEDDLPFDPATAGTLDSGRTRAGAVVGTPAYMPPEQAAGRPVDERADVYALGAVLYEVLAGVRPYHESLDVLDRIAAGPPPALESVVPAVPRDLLAIVRRAMARDPADRYPSARELAADLERFRDGQIVGAYRYGPMELLVRFVRNNRAATAMLVAMVLVVAGAFGVVVRWQRVAEAAGQRERVRADALAVEQARLEVGRDPREALRLLDGLSASYPEIGPVRTLAADALSRGLARRLAGHEGAVGAIVVAPDGSYVATASHDKTAQILDPDGRVRHVLEHPAAVGSLVTLAGDRVATASDTAIRVWDVASGVLMATLPHPQFVQSLERSADGSAFVTTCLDNRVRIYEADGTLRHELPVAHERVLMYASFSPDGTQVASVATDRQLVLWDAATGQQGDRYTTVRSSFRAYWSPDGGRIAVIGTGGVVWVLDVAAKTAKELRGHTAWPSAGVWLPDGTLATAAGDKTVRTWPVERIPQVLLGHTDTVSALAVAPDGGLFSASGDGTVRRWDAVSGAGGALLGARSPVLSVAVGSDGRVIAGDASGAVLAWDPTSQGARRVRVGPGVVRAVGSRSGSTFAFGDDGLWRLDLPTASARLVDPEPLVMGDVSPDGARAVGLSYSGMLLVWDTGTGARLTASAAHDKPVTLELAPDGRAATSGEDGVVRLWSAEGAVVRDLVAAGAPVRQLAWSPDARFLVVGDDANLVHVVDVAAATPPTVFDVHRSFVSDVAFAGPQLLTAEASGTILVWSGLDGVPTRTELAGSRLDAPSIAGSADGRFAAVGDSIGRVTLFELATGRFVPLLGHTQYMAELVFSPDSTRLATTSWDGTARLWDLSDPFGPTPPEGRSLPGNGKPVVAATFTPDGRQLLSYGQDNAVLLWADDLPFETAPLRAAIHDAVARVEAADARSER